MGNYNLINDLMMVSMVCCAAVAPSVYAGNADFALCAKKFPDRDDERLKCFDQALSTPEPAPIEVLTAAPSQAANQRPAPAPYNAAEESAQTEAHEHEDSAISHNRRTYLTRVWNLDNRPNRDQSSLDRLQLHRQNYLIIRKSSSPNNFPTSPGIGNAGTRVNNMDAMEAKFRLSFKTSMYTRTDLDLWGFKTFRLWGAYTQQSHWQVFNTRNSSPFRESNYEPELIAAFGTGNETGLKLLNLGLGHQSNGRGNPESRSWNRVYVQGGWEWDNTSLLARGWYRIPESILKDDNPDIVHYLGSAEVIARWEPDNKSQAVVLEIRNNLNIKNNAGFVQLDWSLPVALGTAARLHFQMTSGYGESLIDYNHRQTTMGLGFSFREW